MIFWQNWDSKIIATKAVSNQRGLLRLKEPLKNISEVVSSRQNRRRK